MLGEDQACAEEQEEVVPEPGETETYFCENKCGINPF